MKLIDLTHPMRDGQPAFPSDPALTITAHCTTGDPGRYNLSLLQMGSHHGTHLDAMFHFVQQGRTLDQMPLDWFFGPAHLLDLPKNAGESITVADFLPFEPLIRPGARLVYRTGWSREFGQPHFFEEFPTLDQAAAQYLADRKIRLLGMDTPTPSRDYYEVHHILLGQEIVIVESLAGLENVPPHFTLCAFPLAIEGGDGSPVRAVALVEEA